MDFNVNLKVYEGPMELLIDLIKKNKIDIYDIPIHIITSEFLNYIENAKELNLDLTSDFILMAATLLEIKSKMLLPKYTFDDEEVEEEDPREALVREIINYEKYKEASDKLREKAEIEAKAFYKLQEDFSTIDEVEFLKNLTTDKLYKAFKNVLKNIKTNEERSIISREFFPIEKANEIILEKLQEGKKVSFTNLIEGYYFTEEIVTFFLSLLELIRMGKILAKQRENFEDIDIMLVV